MRTLVLASSIAVTVTACGPRAVPTSSSVAAAPWAHAASTDTDECKTFKASLPATVTQDSIEVPEDWSQPDGQKIKVFFYYTTAAKTADVVFFNGGPAADSHSSYPVLSQLEPSLPVRFIYVDQRGTGCSDHYPQGESPDVLARLQHYTSRAIVQDAEAIRVKLHGEGSKWRIFGQSYGSFLVHRYLEMAPGSVEAAYAHGFAVMSDSLQLMLDRVSADGPVDAKYLTAYPDDKQVLAKARAQIPETQCFGQGQQRVCGPAVIDGASGVLGFHDAWPYLHAMVKNLVDAHGVIQQAALTSYVNQTILSENSPDALVAGDVISSVEVVPGLYTQDDPSGCKRIEAQLAQAGTNTADWPFDECRLTLAQLASATPDPTLDAAVAALPTDPLSLDALQASLTQHPDVKYYLYAGDLDSFVPPAIYKSEVARLGSRVTFREFPNTGHDGFYNEAQVLTDLGAP